MAMNNEIEKLHEQMKILRGENEELKMENQRMQKALEKKNANILRML